MVPRDGANEKIWPRWGEWSDNRFEIHIYDLPVLQTSGFHFRLIEWYSAVAHRGASSPRERAEPTDSMVYVLCDLLSARRADAGQSKGDRHD